MQGLVNAIRRVGAKNLILLGGLSYSNSLAQWNQYAPKDPLKNIGAAWHSYNFNICNNKNCWNQYVKPTAKKYPVVTTEIGENDCAGGYVTAVMKWLDANAGGNYLAWTFNTWDCRNGPSLISSYENNGTPTPYGVAIKQHYTSLNTQSTNKPKKKGGKKKKNKGQKSTGKKEKKQGQKSAGKKEKKQGQKSTGKNEKKQGQKSAGKKEKKQGQKSAGKKEKKRGQKSAGKKEKKRGQKSAGKNEKKRGQKSAGKKEKKRGQKSAGKKEKHPNRGQKSSGKKG